MTALKAHEVQRYLLRPDLEDGVFLVYGPDTGLVRETAQRLIRAYAGSGPDDATIAVLDGADLGADPSRLAIEARTISLFGGRRIVRVRSAEKSIVLTLTDLLDNPPGAIIVLEAGNLTPKDALRALIEAAKSGRALPCYADTDETLNALIRETFAKQAIRIDAETITALRETLGNDREVTRRELEKLILYASESKVLTYEDVLTLCADNTSLVIDTILDAAGTGHSDRLENAINRAMASNLDTQRLLAVASLHFSQLRRWRTQVDAGKPARDTLQSARPRPHFSRSGALEQQLRLWSDQMLGTACDRILQATQETRRRPALAETTLRRTLLALCMMAATQ